MLRNTLFILFFLLSIGGVSAQDFSDGTWNFTYVTDATGTDVKVRGTTDKGALIIPKTAHNAVNGKTYNVTNIRNNFNQYCLPLPADGGADITSLQIPEGIKIIENQAFYPDFKYVTTFNLPSTMIGITGTYAFTWMSSLESIYCAMQNPFTINVDDQFVTPNATDITKVTLHVPPGKTAAYKAAGWDGFKAYVEDVTEVKSLRSSDMEIVSNSPNSFYLKGIKSDVNVSVLDLSGKNIANFYNVTNNQTLSSSLFQKGIYIVKINEGVQVFCTKLAL
jgi:hypothetical protein